MKAPTINLDGTGIVALVGLAVLGLGAAWLYVNRGKLSAAGAGAAAASAGKAAGTAAVAAADGLFAGVIKGLGGAAGVPDTDASECDRALAEGRTWDASFACPAGRFLGSLGGRETVDQSVLDANDARARSAPGTGASTPGHLWDETSPWAAP